MSVEIICPDCGKPILPADSPVDPMGRCACAKPQAAHVPPAVKTCYVCGKNLSGKGRLKDRLGRYWCVECAKAEKRAHRRLKQFRCRDCNREFPAAKLVNFDGTRLCNACMTAREKAAETRLKTIGIEDAHRRHDLLPIKMMALALLLLVLIALVQWFF
jgi:hypothetical protein